MEFILHPKSRICFNLRKARHANPDTLAFLARTPTRKRFSHSTVYECLKAFFRHASVFETHRHAVYHCLKKPPTFFRHANDFLKRAFRHARVRFQNARFRPSKVSTGVLPARHIRGDGTGNGFMCVRNSSSLGRSLHCGDRLAINRRCT